MNMLAQKTGRSVIAFLMFVTGLFTSLPDETAAIYKHFFSRKRLFRNIFNKEIYHSGLSAIPVLAGIAALVSVLFIRLYPFQRFGYDGENMYGSIFYLLILRELAPLIVLVVISIRSSIYITIQTAQMKVGGEVFTLEILGIDPDLYLGSMRVFAGMLIAPMLGLYYILASILAAALGAWYMYDISMLQFIIETYRQFTFRDILVFVLKMILSGFLIYKIAVYNGITALEKRNMIITRTIRSITQSVASVLILSFLVSMVFYGN